VSLGLPPCTLDTFDISKRADRPSTNYCCYTLFEWVSEKIEFDIQIPRIESGRSNRGRRLTNEGSCWLLASSASGIATGARSPCPVDSPINRLSVQPTRRRFAATSIRYLPPTTSAKVVVLPFRVSTKSPPFIQSSNPEQDRSPIKFSGIYLSYLTQTPISHLKPISHHTNPSRVVPSSVPYLTGGP
jgi:hypothetical protein